MTRIIFGHGTAVFHSLAFPVPLPEREQIIICSGDLTILPSVPVSPMESDRAGRFASKAARGRFLAGRRLLRGVLSGWLSCRAEDVPLEINAGGKPALPEGSGLQFSMSHAGDRVAAAFARTPVGIDLEQERRVDFERLLKRFFGAEQEGAGVPVTNSIEFITFWTVCEAAIKADGGGLAGLLHRTRAEEVPGGGHRVPVDGRIWHAVPFRMEGGYHGAVASGFTPEVIHWCDLRELLK